MKMQNHENDTLGEPHQHIPLRYRMITILLTVGAIMLALGILTGVMIYG